MPNHHNLQQSTSAVSELAASEQLTESLGNLHLAELSDETQQEVESAIVELVPSRREEVEKYKTSRDMRIAITEVMADKIVAPRMEGITALEETLGARQGELAQSAQITIAAMIHGSAVHSYDPTKPSSVPIPPNNYMEYLTTIADEPTPTVEQAEIVLGNWFEWAKIAGSLDPKLLNPEKTFTKNRLALYRTPEDFDKLVEAGHEPLMAFSKLCSASRTDTVEDIISKEREHAERREQTNRHLAEQALETAKQKAILSEVHPISFEQAYQDTLDAYYLKVGEREVDETLLGYIRSVHEGHPIAGIDLPTALKMIDLLTVEEEARRRANVGVTVETPQFVIPEFGAHEMSEFFKLAKGTTTRPHHNDIELRLLGPDDTRLNGGPLAKAMTGSGSPIVRLTSRIPKTAKLEAYDTAVSVWVRPYKPDNPTNRTWKYEKFEQDTTKTSVREGYGTSAALADLRDAKQRHEILSGLPESNRRRF